MWSVLKNVLIFVFIVVVMEMKRKIIIEKFKMKYSLVIGY